MFGRKRRAAATALAGVEARNAALERFAEPLFDADGSMSEKNFARFESWLADHPVRHDYPSAAAAGAARDVFHRVLIGCAQNGTVVLPAATTLALEPGEVAVADLPATLLAATMPAKLDARGVGLPLAPERAKRSVVVGRDGLRLRLQTISGEREAADRGQLTVTNERVVLRGRHGRLEFPLEALLGLAAYRDGVELGSAGSSATLAGIDGEFIGAMIRALAIALQMPAREPGAAPLRP